MNILFNFFKFSYGNIIGILIGVVITIVSTRVLNPSDFGLSSLILIIINILMMISMWGADQSYARYFHELKNTLKSQLLKVSILITIISITIFTLILLTASFLFNIFEVSFIFFALLLFGAVIQFFNRMALTVIRMESKGDIYSLSEIINKITTLVILLLFTLFKIDDYWILVVATLLGMLFSTFFLISKSKKFWIDVKKSSYFSKSQPIKEYYGYGVPLMITTTVTLIFQATDRLTLGILASSSDLGLYAGAMKLIGLLMVTQIIFSNYWVPLSYENYQKKNEGSLFRSIYDTVFVLLFSLGLFVIFSKDYFVLILGEEFKESSQLIPLLVFIPIFHTLSEITSSPINFLKRTTLHIWISIIILCVNAISCFYLVKNFGAVGAALSSTLSYFLFYLLRSYFGFKCINYKFDFKRTIFPLIYLFMYASFSSLLNLSFYINLCMLILGVIIILSFYYQLIWQSYIKIRTENK